MVCAARGDIVRHMQRVPWQLKIPAKIVLAHLPVPYSWWEKIGLFKQGGMERPEYALRIFRKHYDAADFPGKGRGWVGLEVGPGDSLCSGLIARTFGASRTYLVDAESCASHDLEVYRRMEAHLRGLGLNPPKLDDCRNAGEVAEACSAEYLTEGLASLQKLPSDLVDLVWSHAVLPYVRRREFAAYLRELRRIQRPEGMGSHCIPIKDVLDGRLDDLRFSEPVWESALMAKSRFYTNRVRYREFLQLFREAGFEPEVVREIRWERLPTPRKSMAKEFAGLAEEDLLVSEFDVLLH
jgi:SAM-dependent methyltransferase